MTNFLDTHIEWMQDIGVVVRPLDDVPPIETPDDLPHEIQLWFDYRMPHRVTSFQAVGYYSGIGDWLTPGEDHQELELYRDQVFDDDRIIAREEGRYPWKDGGIGRTLDYQAVVYEASPGERAGWLYRVNSEGPETGEPIAKSLSQWFSAVRTLAELGVFDPTVKQEPEELEVPRGARLHAPPDTPLWLIEFGEETYPIGDRRERSALPQLEQSITELLPDFEWVHPIGDDRRALEP